MAPSLGSAGGCEFTFGMKGHLVTDRADEQRRIPRLAEHGRPQIGSGYINQAARPKPDVAIPLCVQMLGQVIVRAAGQIPPVRRRQGVLRQRFEVHHLQLVLRRDGRTNIEPGLLRPGGQRRGSGCTRSQQLQHGAPVTIHRTSLPRGSTSVREVAIAVDWAVKIPVVL